MNIFNRLELLNNWEEKIFKILLVIFFAGVVVGFCIGCGVEKEIATTLK